MKNIQLTCFDRSQTCQVNSSTRRVQINNPLDTHYQLELVNQGATTCQLAFGSKSSPDSDNEFSSQINLFISRDKELFFQGTLADFAKQPVALGTLGPQASNTYELNFDLTSLTLEQQRIAVDFDLLFNFTCATQNPHQAVLAATNIITTQPAPILTRLAELFLPQSPFFYLLLSLFVFIFFVIIKFAHGKKKKN